MTQSADIGYSHLSSLPSTPGTCGAYNDADPLTPPPLLNFCHPTASEFQGFTDRLYGSPKCVGSNELSVEWVKERKKKWIEITTVGNRSQDFHHNRSYPTHQPPGSLVSFSLWLSRALCKSLPLVPALVRGASARVC